MRRRFFDEMSCPDGAPRPAYRHISEWLKWSPLERLRQRAAEAEVMFRRLGITFIVYGDEGGTERLIPFDVIPRVFTAAEWQRVSDGTIQRVRALNMFLHDVYHEQNAIRAGIVPDDLIFANSQYQPQMQGLNVPGGIYTHIAGIDIVRVAENELYVLEDNLRSPSGVAYMVENRRIMMRLFPDLFSDMRVAPVEHYPDVLLRTLRGVAPGGADEPTVVLLTPGAQNSAYYEHAFLADEMGIELVEGADLFVADGAAFMRTTEGPRRVDVIYRRIDDDFIDPLAFRCFLNSAREQGHWIIIRLVGAESNRFGEFPLLGETGASDDGNDRMLES